MQNTDQVDIKDISSELTSEQMEEVKGGAGKIVEDRKSGGDPNKTGGAGGGSKTGGTGGGSKTSGITTDRTGSGGGNG